MLFVFCQEPKEKICASSRFFIFQEFLSVSFSFGVGFEVGIELEFSVGNCSVSPRNSRVCLQSFISIKNAKPATASVIAQPNPSQTPSGKTSATQIAESIVSAICTYKSIKSVLVSFIIYIVSRARTRRQGNLKLENIPFLAFAKK